MSKEKVVKIDIDDLADPMMVVTNRLWDLAREQQNKGNSAMYYVLDDLHSQIQKIILDVKYPDKENE